MAYTQDELPNGLDAKTTPVDADIVPVGDSADSNRVRGVTWANVKATLKTYLDTLYQEILTEGAFVDGDKTKLDGIETAADVTDTTNVTAAGALMDSEVTNLADVKAFDTTDYATSAQGTTADSAVQPGDLVTTLDGTADRFIYVASTGDVTELALGASGTYLESQGATSAPQWSTPSGSGDVAKVGTPVDDQVGVWTGDGTIEGTTGFTKTATQLTVGNYVLNIDETVGAGQDNYVLTYDNGSGEIGLEAATGGSGFTWNEETGTSATAAVNNGYITNNASLVTITLPTTATEGDVIRIVGKGAGGWRLAQPAGTTVTHFGNADSTIGNTGYLEFTNRYDSIEIVCTDWVSTVDFEWTVISSVGNITVV